MIGLRDTSYVKHTTMEDNTILNTIRTLTVVEKLIIVRLKDSGAKNETIPCILNNQEEGVERALRLRLTLDIATTKLLKQNHLDLRDKLHVLHFLTKDLTVSNVVERSRSAQGQCDTFVSERLATSYRSQRSAIYSSQVACSTVSKR